MRIFHCYVYVSLPEGKSYFIMQLVETLPTSIRWQVTPRSPRFRIATFPEPVVGPRSLHAAQRPRGPWRLFGFSGDQVLTRWANHELVPWSRLWDLASQSPKLWEELPVLRKLTVVKGWGPMSSWQGPWNHPWFFCLEKNKQMKLIAMFFVNYFCAVKWSSQQTFWKKLFLSSALPPKKSWERFRQPSVFFNNNILGGENSSEPKKLRDFIWGIEEESTIC